MNSSPIRARVARVRVLLQDAVKLAPDDAPITALLATQLGDRDVALRWLDAAVEELCPTLSFAAVHPAFRPLHREPRFRAIVRRIGRDSALSAPR